MKTKKIFAAALAATTLLGTALPTMADTTTVQNLTAADYTYSQATTVGSTTDTIMFSVANADASWSPVAMTEDEAAAVNWEVKSGSVDGIEIYPSYDVMDDGYMSICLVDTTEVTTDGLAVIEATNTSGGYVDFTVVVNPVDPTEKSVGNISCKLLNSDNNTMAEFNGLQVKSTASSEESTYVSAMDAVASLVGKTDANGNEIGFVNIAYGMMNSITINGTSYPNDGSYWMYRVYDANGNMRSLSEVAGAGVLKLYAGDTVVWKLGQYGSIEFPDTL